MKAMTTARMDSLIGDNYSILKFADLSTPYQMSIIWYTVMECEGWSEVECPHWSSDEDCKLGLFHLIPKYVELYGEELFGILTISAVDMKQSVMNDEDISNSYASWDEYHADYTKGETIKHPEGDRWPVLLSYDNYETLTDGWHRLHSYMRDGAEEIPAIFNPLEHHIKFKNEII